jgi:hypothetical protein
MVTRELQPPAPWKARFQAVLAASRAAPRAARAWGGQQAQRRQQSAAHSGGAAARELSMAVRGRRGRRPAGELRVQQRTRDGVLRARRRPWRQRAVQRRVFLLSRDVRAATSEAEVRALLRFAPVRRRRAARAARAAQQHMRVWSSHAGASAGAATAGSAAPAALRSSSTLTVPPRATCFGRVPCGCARSVHHHSAAESSMQPQTSSA